MLHTHTRLLFNAIKGAGITLSLSCFALHAGAETLASFEEDGSEIYSSADADFVTRSSDSYKWDAFDNGKSLAPSWGYLEIDNTVGAKKTNSSLKLTVTGGRSNPYKTPQETCGGEISSKQEATDHPERICDSSTGAGGFNYWFLSSDRGDKVPGIEGANRISFYTKIPSEFKRKYHHSGEPKNYNLHFGTYTRDPSKTYSDGANLGRHFYHWININGSDEYWTKIIIDNHPQHEVGKSGEDPGDNPTGSSFNYIEGFTRFYFKTKYNLLPNPWPVWIDEFEIYNDPRPMPPKVATIALSQVGPDDFEVSFASTDEGSGSSNVNTFEVRYSTSPITDANFKDATIVSGSPAVTGDYERYAYCKAENLDIGGADIVYFAIRQTDENSNKIAYAEYEMSAAADFSPIIEPPVAEEPSAPLPPSKISAKIQVPSGN